jgi:hypothetical protein
VIRPWLLTSFLVSAAPAFAADEIHWTVIDPNTVTFDWRGTNNTIRYGVTASYDTAGTLSWTPDVDDTGSYVISFHAPNALTTTALTSIQISESVGVGTPSRVPVLSLESALPNPSRGTLRITYAVASSEPVGLDLADASGRVLVHQDLGSPGPGRHVYLLGRSSEVTPGLYWLRLTQARHTQVAKIAFLR